MLKIAMPHKIHAMKIVMAVENSSRLFILKFAVRWGKSVCLRPSVANYVSLKRWTR